MTRAVTDEVRTEPDLPRLPPSFWSLVLRAAEARPDAVVLADDHGRALTTTQFAFAAEQCAAGLWSLGLRPHHVVSWQLPTVLEASVLLGACARLGVVQNPIIPLLREREVGFITREISADLLVVPESWRGFAHGAMGGALGLDVLPLDLEDLPESDLRLPAGPPDDLGPRAEPAPTECRWLYYSSGTTADPKGVRHSDASLMAGSNSLIAQLGLAEGDVIPIPWPFAHIGGACMLTAVLRAGGTLVLFDAWDPATTPYRMAKHRPTVLGSATPFFLAYIAAQAECLNGPLYPALRACTGGGAPVPEAVSRGVAEALGVRGVTGSWGLTEFPVATGQTPRDEDLGLSVGQPAPGVEVRVVDGELRLKGPQACLGFVDPWLDREGFDEEGWVRTGDLGHVDDAGRVHVTGRRKDVIIRYAENISANEVEEMVLQHPRVLDAAVVGLPDDRTGERVCAVLVVDGPSIDLTELAAYCINNGLARFKCPEQIEVVDSLPRNAMGKILKAELRSTYVTK